MPLRILTGPNPLTGRYGCGKVLLTGWRNRGAIFEGELVTFRIDDQGTQHCRVKFNLQNERAHYVRLPLPMIEPEAPRVADNHYDEEANA